MIIKEVLFLSACRLYLKITLYPKGPTEQGKIENKTVIKKWG